MIKKTLILSAVLVSLLTACSQSPMEQLHSDVKADNLNGAFWSKEHDDKTALWMEAVGYCKTHHEKVNCGELWTTYMIMNGSTEMKGYGTSGDIIDIHGGMTTADYYKNAKK